MVQFPEEFEAPEGWVKLPWAEAQPGQEVWVLTVTGCADGEWRCEAKGPYRVGPSRHTVRDHRGKVRRMTSERLLVKKEAT